MGWRFFCESDEASAHQACMNGHLPTAHQRRDMEHISALCGKVAESDVGYGVVREKRLGLGEKGWEEGR